MRIFQNFVVSQILIIQTLVAFDPLKNVCRLYSYWQISLHCMLTYPNFLGPGCAQIIEKLKLIFSTELYNKTQF